ncbi:iron dicitrate transport regulator FecR [Caulobacter sp. CCUG 60055]|uniref:FecR family protein n=1 Tax=Caulobacter sp. CCUG 60055 TaxID=2100090 RepID=UPI001FA777B9|nr:FecR domain-containing protein [Caulobacter sp. CCUG 60055]MBQ1543185.1 FecR domain-containing protein [Caulobacteraceae bacterium]MCI3179916.1 iron dicitrate transport regulator FecR [Caulobacter sp. CCUG 60055]
MSALRFSDCLDPRSQAAYWLSQRRSGDMSAYDLRAFQVWFERDAANRDAYRRLEQHWELLAGVAQDPEIMAAREHDAAAFDRPSHLRTACSAAAGLVLAVTAGWTLFTSGLLTPRPPAPPPERPMQAFSTNIGQSALLTLPDGSLVTLDTDSALRLRETPSQRLVFLDKGRAYFKVAKDPNRPFIVAVGDKTVRATGTAFDVRRDPGEITVTLVEGKVRVEQPAAGTRTARRTDMSAGGQLVAGDARDWSLTEVDLQKEMGWLNGRLNFFHEPLSHAVDEVNRYSVRKVVFRGGRIPDKHIVGVFRAGDTESFAKAVEMYHLARITAITDDRIELSVQR